MFPGNFCQMLSTAAQLTMSVRRTPIISFAEQINLPLKLKTSKSLQIVWLTSLFYVLLMFNEYRVKTNTF